MRAGDEKRGRSAAGIPEGDAADAEEVIKQGVRT